MISFTAACDDPNLLGLDLWPAQREVAEALDGDARMAVCAWGRRSGKTTLAAAAAVHDCCLRPELDSYIRPGERRYSLVVATSREQARVTLQAARSLVEGSPMLRELLESATEDELRFSTGSAFRAVPCGSRQVRGFPVSCLVMDEAAHFLTETDGYATAQKVWEALAPSTAQFGLEARILVTSTPYGTTGLFADLFERASKDDLDGAIALHATTAEANPTIGADFLEAERRRDEDSFRVEYLAEFTGSGDAYLDLDRFTPAERGPLGPKTCHSWIAGLDPAFSRDPFGLAIVGHSHESLGWWRLGHIESIPPARGEGGFDQTLERIIATLGEFGCKRVLTDQFSSAAIIDRLRGAGIECELVTMSASSKTEVYGELRTLLYQGALEVYSDSSLMAELGRLRTRYTAGSASVVSPRVGSSHGDAAQALALCAWHIGRKGNARAESINLRDLAYQNANPTIRGRGMTLTGKHHFDRDPGGSGERLPPPGWERVETRRERGGRHGR